MTLGELIKKLQEIERNETSHDTTIVVEVEGSSDDVESVFYDSENEVVVVGDRAAGE